MVAMLNGLMWQSYSVPADEKVVRATAVPVNMTKAPAVMDNQPEMGEVETDSDPDLGMAPRQLASAWHEGQRTTPEWLGRVDAVTESNASINRQVSSSGTAASREQAGHVNKNLSYAVGIEPVTDLGPAGGFGNEYFVRNERDVQDTSDNTMMTTPPGGYDHTVAGQVSAAGKANSRAAADPYALFWNGGK